MCHFTEMKHNTVHFSHFTQSTSQNTSLTNVNANFKRMEITKFINKLTTNLYIYRKYDIVHNSIGSVEQFIVRWLIKGDSNSNIIVFRQKELHKPRILIQVSSKSVKNEQVMRI